VDYRLLYTRKALNDLEELIGHIADGDVEAASCFRNVKFSISRPKSLRILEVLVTFAAAYLFESTVYKS
jgi:hypothetical protein